MGKQPKTSFLGLAGNELVPSMTKNTDSGYLIRTVKEVGLIFNLQGIVRKVLASDVGIRLVKVNHFH